MTYFSLGFDSLQWLFIILFLNTLLALVYAVIFSLRIGVRAWIHGLIMFFCPIVGAAMLTLGHVVLKVLLRNKEVDLEAVSFSHDKKRFIFAPGDEEADLVPIEESLLVAPIQDRRRAFLNSIRLNVNKDASLYTLGLENEDSETSHYSASVVMEANASFLEDIQAYSVQYAREPENAEIALPYAAEVKEYLDSGIPRGIEIARYQNLYTALMDGLRAKHRELLEPEHYANTVTCLLRLSEFPRALEWAHEGIARFPDLESAHLNLLKVHYTMGDSEAMRRALDHMNSGFVSLSREGLDLVRFFTGSILEAGTTVSGLAGEGDAE
jgi:hypothetical protein